MHTRGLGQGEILLRDIAVIFGVLVFHHHVQQNVPKGFYKCLQFRLRAGCTYSCSLTLKKPRKNPHRDKNSNDICDRQTDFLNAILKSVTHLPDLRPIPRIGEQRNLLFKFIRETHLLQNNKFWWCPLQISKASRSRKKLQLPRAPKNKIGTYSGRQSSKTFRLCFTNGNSNTRVAVILGILLSLPSKRYNHFIWVWVPDMHHNWELLFLRN